MFIEIDRLRATIGDVTILHDVHMTLAQGEIYGLLGPNGAGKSTTIAVGLGLLEREAGDVRLFGEDPRLAAPEYRARIGVLPEQNGFYEWLSAEEYLSFFADLYGRHLSTEAIHKRLDDVGLEPRPRQTIGTYSRGMRQRLGLARALIADPELLILDEPTNGLDPRGRREIHDILLALAADGVGILLCTHILDDVERLCRRIGILVEGRTVAEGAITDLLGNEGQKARFQLLLSGTPPSDPGGGGAVSLVGQEGEWWIVDLDPGVSPDTAWSNLLSRGWPIREIRRESEDLEDFYLALTERRAA